MSDDKKFSEKFNKVAKGAAFGAGAAIVGAAILPIVTVSAPVIAVGAAIGAWLGYKKD